MEKEQVEKLQAMLPGLPEQIQGKAALQLGWGLASSDPLAAAGLIQKYPAAAEGNFVSNLGIRLMLKVDLAEARTWADSLPANVQKDAYSGIVDGSYRYDSEAISLWAKDLPAGPSRDGAASALARSAREDDPAAAFAWAVSIQDQKLVKDSIKAVLNAWVPEDRDAALQALESAPLSSQQKAEILKSVSPTNSAR
jgi:hypothetical protein